GGLPGRLSRRQASEDAGRSLMGDATRGTVKVAVVGAGSVGATLAYACLIRGVAQQVALYDLNRDKVEAEVLDLRHGLQFVPRADVVGSDDIAVCAGADVVAITAGGEERARQHRLDRAGTSLGRGRTLGPQLL